MRLHKFTATFTLFYAALFAAIALLVQPVWQIVQQRLNSAFPVMPIAGSAAALAASYAAMVRFVVLKRSPHPWRHSAALWLFSLLVTGGWALLYSSMGTETALVSRILGLIFPYLLFAGALAGMIWFAPIWPPLRKPWLRGLLIIAFILVALGWLAGPFSVRIASQPVAFLAQDGINIVWATTMRSVNRLEYGHTPALGKTITPQKHGLRSLGANIQSAFIPVAPLVGDVYFKATSQGVRSVYPIAFATAGQVESDIMRFKLPQPGRPLAWVAFSDLHEQKRLVRRLAGHIPWQEMEFVVYLGDLLNSTTNQAQVAESILELPTGGINLPRLYARGNHEPRGPGGRTASQWLLPPGREWYFTTQLGDIFFVILNSGEDSADNDSKYAGLVNFAEYHRQQANWLAGVFASPEYRQAKAHIVLAHIPPFTWAPEYAPEFQPVLDLLLQQGDIALLMAGHTHEPGIFLPAETGLPFPVSVCGGSSPEDMAAVLARYSASGLQISVIDIYGRTLQHIELPPPTP